MLESLVNLYKTKQREFEIIMFSTAIDITIYVLSKYKYHMVNSKMVRNSSGIALKDIYIYNTYNGEETKFVNTNEPSRLEV